MHLHHEVSMIRVECQLMICRGHIRAYNNTFQIFFVIDGSILLFGLHFKSNLKGS